MNYSFITGPPYDVKIEPSDADLLVGTTLTCSGKSQPGIDSYTWIDVSDDDTFLASESEFEIPEDWVNAASKTVKCLVKNTMRPGTDNIITEVESANYTFGVFSKSFNFDLAYCS